MQRRWPRKRKPCRPTRKPMNQTTPAPQAPLIPPQQVADLCTLTQTLQTAVQTWNKRKERKTDDKEKTGDKEAPRARRRSTSGRTDAA
eukprot:3661213-Prorocentrum_lima.AAC.1